MWITDLRYALDILYHIYENSCCIEKIANGIIYMTDGNCYSIEELISGDDESEVN